MGVGRKYLPASCKSPIEMATGGIEEGYEHDFVSVPDDSLHCRICLSVARDPRQHSKCGQLYCYTCLQKHKATSNSCPWCKADNADFFEDKRSHRQILSLLVKCIRHKDGCIWQGELGDLHHHVAKKCDYREVNCSLKCDTTMKYVTLDHHVKEECPNRLIRCSGCGKEGPYWYIATDHKKECLYILEKCPAPGCDVEMCSVLMTFHLQTECEYSLVECKYRGVGCTAILTRRHMEEHENNDRYHLKLLAQSHTSLKEKYQQLEASNTSLQEKYTELEESNALQQEKYRELEDSQQVKYRRLEASHTLQQEKYTKLEAFQQKQYREWEAFDLLQQEKFKKLLALNQKLLAEFNELQKSVTSQCSKWEESSRPSETFHIFHKDLYDKHLKFYATPKTYRFQATFRRTNFHCIVRIQVKNGDNDPYLHWPFTGKVKVQILNPIKDNDHLTKTVKITRQGRPACSETKYAETDFFIDDIKEYKDNGYIYFRFIVISDLCQHWLMS